jgi:divalent metal cation (Fe/Co/Zn/Cd) transporter
MKPLLDARLPTDEEQRIKDILNHDERVLGYHKLRTRKSGSQRHADVHVLIDDGSTLLEAHDLTEELEDHVRTTLPDIHINIHIEPYHAEMRHQQEAHGLSQEEANPKIVEAAPVSGAAEEQ